MSDESFTSVLKSFGHHSRLSLRVDSCEKEIRCLTESVSEIATEVNQLKERMNNILITGLSACFMVLLNIVITLKLS